jgi:hypothetical protein
MQLQPTTGRLFKPQFDGHSRTATLEYRMQQGNAFLLIGSCFNLGEEN